MRSPAPQSASPQSASSQSTSPQSISPNATRSLLQSLGWSAIGFLVTGLLIRQFIVPPQVALLIDRSYCSTDDWQQLSQTYSRLYQQHQRQTLRLQPVVLFSNLNQDSFETPPSPKAIQNTKTYGQADMERKLALQQTYPAATLLSCHTSSIQGQWENH